MCFAFELVKMAKMAVFSFLAKWLRTTPRAERMCIFCYIAFGRFHLRCRKCLFCVICCRFGCTLVFFGFWGVAFAFGVFRFAPPNLFFGGGGGGGACRLFWLGLACPCRCPPCAVFRGAEPQYIWFYIIRFVSVISAYNQFNALKTPYTIYIAFSTWRLTTLLYYILLSFLTAFRLIAFYMAFFAVLSLFCIILAFFC